jgi:hypothetical protein
VRILLTASVAAALGCGELGGVTQPIPPPAGIFVTNSYRTQLAVGDTFDVSVSYTGGDAIVWNVTGIQVVSPAVAAVTPGGAIVATAPGAANLTVQISTTRGAASAFGTLNVLEPAALVEHRLVSVSDRACAARSASGALVCWSDGVDAQGVAYPPSELAGAPSFRQLDMGQYHSCGVAADSSAYCWGLNQRGELGIGDSTYRTVPGLVAGGRKWLRVTVGDEFSCGIAADSTAYCWGYNLSGRLGIGTETSSPVPVAVSGAMKFTSLDAGKYHSCGVRLDGALLCWGDAAFVRTGAWEIAAVLAPKAIADVPAMASVSASTDHSCAVTLEGVPWCWGSGARGELGRVLSAFEASLPTPVSGTPPLVFIAVDGAKSCGLTAAGAAWCWGERPLRERDYSIVEGFATPTALPGGNAFRAIDLGTNVSCGITTSDELMCWGYNGSFGVGDGTNINRLAPRRVRP